MKGEGYRVLIVGAGIAGLATARALKNWGASVELVERTSEPRVEGAGLYLPANGFRALDALGLGEAVAKRAVEIERQQFRDLRGRLLSEIDLADAWQGVGPCLALHRAALHEVLADGAAGIPIRWGRTVTAINRSVTFDDSTSERFDLVVGADGIRSTVRTMLFGTAGDPRPVGQYARRFVVEQPGGDSVWSVQLGKGRVFLSLPIGNGDLYCFCDGPALKPGGSPEPLRELLAGFGEPVPTLLRALEASGGVPQSGPIEEVVLPTWSRTDPASGNAVLVGDAAHATSPNMAEGAAMAIEDAIVLAESLTDEPNTAAALQRFEARRRPRTDWVLARTHDRDRTRSLPPVLRNFVLRRTGQKLYRSHYSLLRALP